MENVSLTFAAIDQTYVNSIPTLTEPEYGGKDYIYYGEDNSYPNYLFGLYTDVSSLKTVIDGTSEYVAGDDAVCNIEGLSVEVNRKGLTARELIQLLARDYLLYGGFSLQIIRNKTGKVVELYPLDFRFCRCDKYNESIYYNEDFGKKYARSNKSVVYPKFIRENTDIYSSVLYVKNTNSSTYPTPKYSGALKACEIERHLDEFFLNSLENGFTGSAIINFLNGVPTDEQKKEIEKNIQNKFAGSKNAGRIILNFANGKENAATIEKIDVEDFGDKYSATAKRSREQIFTAFQASPVLFGLSNENTSWNDTDYKEAFKLYNKTIIRGLQRMILGNFDKIFGVQNSFVIKPFTVDFEEETNNDNKAIS